LPAPPRQLDFAPRRDPVAVSARSPVGAQDLQRREAGAPQLGKGGIDLRELRPPERVELLIDSLFQLVSGRGSLRNQGEENVLERHARLYHSIYSWRSGGGVSSGKKDKKRGARRPLLNP